MSSEAENISKVSYQAHILSNVQFYLLTGVSKLAQGVEPGPQNRSFTPTKQE